MERSYLDPLVADCAALGPAVAAISSLRRATSLSVQPSRHTSSLTANLHHTRTQQGPQRQQQQQPSAAAQTGASASLCSATAPSPESTPSSTLPTLNNHTATSRSARRIPRPTRASPVPSTIADRIPLGTLVKRSASSSSGYEFGNCDGGKRDANVSRRSTADSVIAVPAGTSGGHRTGSHAAPGTGGRGRRSRRGSAPPPLGVAESKSPDDDNVHKAVDDDHDGEEREETGRAVGPPATVR